ncbi:hypothetical protein F5Y08DRAFT_103472 [Xylaria arbuscula]|nr:hypothetical protein F5Y08DRAFT_103472 [Xylaria arbuscula]
MVLVASCGKYAYVYDHMILMPSQAVRSQQRWVRDELRSLQKLDLNNRLLCTWCIYPSPKRRGPPFEPNEYWRCFYPGSDSEFHQDDIVKRLGIGSASPGRTIVVCMLNTSRKQWLLLTYHVACGDPKFTGQIRNIVLQNPVMEYVEVEYRPNYSSQRAERVNLDRRRRQRRAREVDLESLGVNR